jgi:hypothetical protein
MSIADDHEFFGKLNSMGNNRTLTKFEKWLADRYEQSCRDWARSVSPGARRDFFIQKNFIQDVITQYRSMETEKAGQK